MQLFQINYVSLPNGAASAAEDVSTDVVDASADAVVVDAVSEDVSDSVESIDDEVEPVVDDSAPAQDEIDDVELGASVDEEPALDESNDEILTDTVQIINSDDYSTSKKFRQALNSLISSATGNTTIIFC